MIFVSLLHVIIVMNQQVEALMNLTVSVLHAVKCELELSLTLLCAFSI